MRYWALGFEKLFDAKVVDTEDKHGAFGVVVPEACTEGNKLLMVHLVRWRQRPVLKGMDS